MVSMTVANFISAIGSSVKYITYDTTKSEGVKVSGTTANVYNVAITGNPSNSSGQHFYSSLISADLRGLDVSGMTSFNCLFYKCANLENVDVSTWNTSNITNFSVIFGECYKLEKIDLSSFDTSKSTTFNALFRNCKKLAYANLSSFNTAKCTNILGMFQNIGTSDSLALIEIGNNWTLSKAPKTYSTGTNLKFVQKREYKDFYWNGKAKNMYSDTSKVDRIVYLEDVTDYEE